MARAKKDLQQHLKERIEDDQLLLGINALDDTTRTGAERHWAVSQMIQPTAEIGKYDSQTGRILISKDIEIGTSTNGAGTATHTITAGARPLKVHLMTMRNATRNFTWSLTLNGEIVYINPTVILSTIKACVVGGVGTITTANQTFGPRYIYVPAGQSLILTDTSFVALDTTTFFSQWEVL